MKTLTLDDYKRAGEEFYLSIGMLPRNWVKMLNLSKILKVMEAVGTVALKLVVEDKLAPFGFNKKKDDGDTTEGKAKLSDSFGGTVEKDIPADAEWIDEAFYIKKTRFGLYTSI